MTPKDRRTRLFKKSRPHIRPLERQDMGWLWAAYKAGSFNFPPDLSQEAFAQQMEVALSSATHYLAEDDNAKFQSRKGPVALIGVATDGEKLEPAFAMFKWASPRNVLRVYVGFYQWVRSSSKGERFEARVAAKDKLFKRLVDYGVIAPRKVEIVYGPRCSRLKS